MLACGVGAYVLSGFLSGRALRVGVGGLLALSCALVAVALTGYASTPRWAAFLPLAAVHGLGSGAIDAALNGYAARHFAARHVNWLHACWGVGAFAGPPIMTAGLVLSGSYRPGYAILAAVLASMAIAFALTRRRWDGRAGAAEPRTERPEAVAVTARAALRDPAVRLQMALFFLYNGIETSTGAWAVTVLQRAHGLGTEAAGAWITAFWLCLFLGRIGLGFVVDAIGPDRLLRICTFVALLGAGGFAAGGAWARAALPVLALGLSPLFPTLMHRTPARVGAARASHAVGFQVSAASIGASLVPWGLGILAGRLGASAIPPILLAEAALFVVLHELLLRRHTPAARPAHGGLRT
jgi:fucose permease